MRKIVSALNMEYLIWFCLRVLSNYSLFIVFSLTVIYIYIYIFRCSIQASRFHEIPQYQPQYFFARGLNLDFIKGKGKVFPTL